jgi:hypothetical protein
MRRHDVFGKKITQIRPFYLLILVFIIILPSHFILNFYQQSKVNDLETERIKLELEINSLLLEHQNEVIDDVTIGQIYSGFEPYYFDYYLEEDINLYLDLAGLSLVESKLINISDVTISPFTENISTEVAYKKIDLEFVTDDQDKLFDFITILLGQDQLFYVENLESNLLEDDSLRINMTIYTFYLLEAEE